MTAMITYGEFHRRVLLIDDIVRDGKSRDLRVIGRGKAFHHELAHVVIARQC